MTQTSLTELCNTHVFSCPQETVQRENCLLVGSKLYARRWAELSLGELPTSFFLFLQGIVCVFSVSHRDQNSTIALRVEM